MGIEDWHRLYRRPEKQANARAEIGLGSAAVEDVPVFAAAAHDHDAADIITGVIAPARLGTGSPTSADVLYGDGTWAPPPGGGSGITDGDYGDITVSAGGTALTIDGNAVTFAKMQAVSANVLLGNDASGTAIEEIACTAAGRALLDDADAAAQRATLGLAFRGALVEKTSNQSITSAGAAVSWDATAYDTTAFWSGGAPTRLTVPSGVTHVRLSAAFRTTTNNINITGYMLKNGSDVFAGNPGSYSYTSTGAVMLVSPVLSVTGGDYFEAFYLPPSTINLIGGSGRRSWFAIEALP